VGKVKRAAPVRGSPDGAALESKSFKHVLMKHLKPLVYASGYGHRITDGSLSTSREIRWKLFIEAVKAYDLNGYRSSIDEMLVRDEHLKVRLSHSLFDMFNTSLKVISLTRLIESSSCSYDSSTFARAVRQSLCTQGCA
jgi:hypothetical protein